MSRQDLWLLLGRWRGRLGAGFLSFVTGLLLFRTADCFYFQVVLLGILVLLALTMSAVYLFRNSTSVSPNTESTITLGVFIFPLLVQFLVAPPLAQTFWVKVMFCPGGCSRLEHARELRLAGALDGAELEARQCTLESSGECRRQCGIELVRTLYTKAENLMLQGNCLAAKLALDEADERAKEFDAPEGDRKVIVQMQKNYEQFRCAPTPTPSSTPTITRTPTPSSTPTATSTATRILQTATPTPLPACRPPAFAPAKRILLVNKIPAQESLKPFVRRVFAKPEVDLSLNGGEIVCLASTDDGRGALWVDDEIVFQVVRDQTKVWIQDFYDPDTHLIKPFPAADVSYMFGPGTSQVTLSLWDLRESSFGTEPIWLIVWQR